MGGIDLYRLKPASQRMLRPLEDALVARHVRPDAITAAAIPVSLAAGLCLALSDRVPILLLGVPFLAAARLVLNLLDGLVARRTGASHALGEVWNEVGDRACDILILGGLAFITAVDPRLALGALVAALLASYAGVAARAAGGTRQYGGVMSKPGRMLAIGLAALLTFFTGDGRWLAVGAAVILAGALLTLAARLRASWRELGHGG